MKPMTGFINIYKSGWFHRKGKPNMLDRHPGDIYLTMEAAQQDIDPAAAALYVGTVPIMWIEPEDALALNAPDSHPVPLRESRRQLGEYTVPSQTLGLSDNVLPFDRANAGRITAEEIRKQWAKATEPPMLAIEYKPTHGGYPDA